VDRIRYDELAENLHRHYAVTGEPRPAEAEDRLKWLGHFLNGWRILDLRHAAQLVHRTTSREGIANSAINNELNVRSRMLRLGYEHNKVPHAGVS
jgi:hypothetical protein